MNYTNGGSICVNTNNLQHNSYSITVPVVRTFSGSYDLNAALLEASLKNQGVQVLSDTSAVFYEQRVVETKVQLKENK